MGGVSVFEIVSRSDVCFFPAAGGEGSFIYKGFLATSLDWTLVLYSAIAACLVVGGAVLGKQSGVVGLDDAFDVFHTAV